MGPLLLFLVWPLLEIAGFVLVGSKIGVLSTIGLVLLSGFVGAVLMRVQGFGVLAKIQREMQEGGNPGRNLAHGLMILLAGLLLFLPGFFSDIIGIALFIPPVRDLAWNFLRKRVKIEEIRVGRGFQRESGPAGGSGRTIDLDASDYSSTSNPQSPWRPIDRDDDR